MIYLSNYIKEGYLIIELIIIQIQNFAITTEIKVQDFVKFECLCTSLINSIIHLKIKFVSNSINVIKKFETINN